MLRVTILVALANFLIVMTRPNCGLFPALQAGICGGVSWRHYNDNDGLVCNLRR